MVKTKKGKGRVVKVTDDCLVTLKAEVPLMLVSRDTIDGILDKIRVLKLTQPGSIYNTRPQVGVAFVFCVPKKSLKTLAKKNIVWEMVNKKIILIFQPHNDIETMPVGSSELDEEYFTVTGEDAKKQPKSLVKVVEAVGLTGDDRWETALVLDKMLKDRHRRPVPVSIFFRFYKNIFFIS